MNSQLPTPNFEPLKIAMIGCGGYANYLSCRIAEVPEFCTLVAVSTHDFQSPAADAMRTKGVTVFAGVDEMLDSLSPETCDAVIVPTSIESHFDYTRRIVERGFHVLLEKPPVAAIQDLDQLIELQRRSGKWIAVNFQYLYTDMTQNLKWRLMSGEFGAVKSVKARALWRRPESYFLRNFWSGKLKINGRWVLDGVIGNPLAHLLAEALYLAAPDAGMLTPETVEAELYHANETEGDDTSCVRISGANEVAVYFYGSLCGAEQSQVFCEIETDRAQIQFTEFSEVEIHFHDGKTESGRTPEYEETQPRRRMLAAIAARLLNDEKPLITVEECRPYMLAWNGAFESFGFPAALPESAFVRQELEEYGTTRVLPEIKALMTAASENGQLFSENGAAWARPGRKISLDDYSFFPSENPALMEKNPQVRNKAGRGAAALQV
ncbi:MAG: Gfo/Idh/MocA family oxidoreductase [Kiritimatiellales bacterium]